MLFYDKNGKVLEPQYHAFYPPVDEICYDIYRRPFYPLTPPNATFGQKMENIQHTYVDPVARVANESVKTVVSEIGKTINHILH